MRLAALWRDGGRRWGVQWGIPDADQSEQARMMFGVGIGVCSDVHGRHDRLLIVLGTIAAARVDERWRLGDLVGREPVRSELVGAARQLDLLIAGNHDAWAIGPDRLTTLGRDVFRLASWAMAIRRGIDCWHGSVAVTTPRGFLGSERAPPDRGDGRPETAARA